MGLFGERRIALGNSNQTKGPFNHPKSEVPESFTEGLLEKYPNATGIEWEKTGTDYVQSRT